MRLDENDSIGIRDARQGVSARCRGPRAAAAASVSLNLVCR
jgi:hypothetical protein